MPKILRIINRFNLGGPTYNVAYLTKYLAPEYETLLIGGDKEEDEGSSTFILESMGIKPVIVPELKREIDWKSDRAAYRKIKDIIREFKPDIVHTHASKAGALGRLAAHHEKVPLIFHTFHGHVFHSYFGKLKTSFYINIERWLATKCNSVIAISPTQKKELSEVYRIAKPDKIRVVNLGFDLERFTKNNQELRDAFRKKYFIGADETVITIIGRLAPVKNHMFFVKVIQELLKNKKTGLRFFIVGDGETKLDIEEQLKQFSIDYTDFTQHQARATVTFTSWIKNIEFALAGSDVICLTSDNEGTPVSLIEAQAAGKPVVSTNVGGVQDIIEKGCGLYSEVGNISKMAENISFFMERRSESGALSKKAREAMLNKFHYSILVNQMNKVYKEHLDQLK